MIKAPSKMAAVALPGMPRVNSGIRELPVTALLAVSDAQIPSSEPLPNLSRYFEKRFASL